MQLRRISNIFLPSEFNEMKNLINESSFDVWSHGICSAFPQPEAICYKKCNPEKCFSFSHRIDENSIFYNRLWNSLVLGVSNLYFDTYKILRARLGLFIPHGEKLVQSPHVDNMFDHHTILFYFSSEGETYLYNEFLDIENKTDHDTFTTYKKIKPIENSAVLFEGLRYHSSSSPINDNRLTLTINLINNLDYDPVLMNQENLW